MKLKSILFAALISSCLAQEPDAEPKVSFVQAAQIAQDTLKTQNLGSELYIREMRLTKRQDKPTEWIYEARFDPHVQASSNSGEEAAVVRYRVIAVDMQGIGALEEREFTPRVIRRKILPPKTE